MLTHTFSEYWDDKHFACVVLGKIKDNRSISTIKKVFTVNFLTRRILASCVLIEIHTKPFKHNVET